MTEVIVIAEGQTEEQFIKRVVAPALRPLGLHLKPQLLATSTQGRGGAVSFDHFKWHARNTLRQRPAVVLTTLLDLYGLDTEFPGFMEARRETQLLPRVQRLESALHGAIVEHAGCRPERFIPHIQPHEFEGLLFSDPDAMIQIEPDWAASLDRLRQVRAAVPTPEHINDGYDTKPSRRLEILLYPAYKKTRHGPLAAERIGVAAMERECPHFRAWMDALRGIPGCL